MAQTSEQNYLPEEAELFTGKYIDAMPALLKEGLVPVSPSWVMDERNKVASTGQWNVFWDDYFDTDFGFAADSEKIYLFPHSGELRKVTSDTKPIDDGIVLPSEFHAKTFSRKGLNLDESLTEKQAVEHPLWLELAEGNKERLDQYVQNAFRIGKDVYNYNKIMCFYVPDDKKPILRAVVLNKLCSDASVTGARVLGHYGARLFGVRPAREKISQTSLEEEILRLSSDFVPDPSKEEWNKRLTALLKNYNLTSIKS